MASHYLRFAIAGASCLLLGCSLQPLTSAATPPALPPIECDGRVRLAHAGAAISAGECPAPRSPPADIAEARASESARLTRVLHAWTASFQGDWQDFGDWERDGTRTGLRKVMAGLQALKTLAPDDPLRPPPHFPKLVERWLTQQASAHCRAGTDTQQSPVRASVGDYDFTMLQILELIYHFKDDPELLSNDSIWALLHNERYRVRAGRGIRLKTRIPEVGNWPHRMTFDVVAHFPETENHVLISNTWAYLIGQWLEHDYRNDSRVREYFLQSPEDFRNEGSWLERLLLSVVARPLHSGFFETNARPYNAYSLRALQLLASYADSSTNTGHKLKLAAHNALDYAATKFAFQSFQGKRYGPSRRNYRYRTRLGVYDGDYVPFIFGVLTGAHVYDDSADCRGRQCPYTNPQTRGFALESALSDYRVPESIWDFMLRPDNHRVGHAVWVRMQPRFTERHYLQGKWPRYPGRTPRLARALDSGHAAIEPAPELYFISQDYMNSAGGRAEHYAGLDAWLPDALLQTNDLFAKPSTLMLRGDIGYWQSFEQLAQTTLAFEGESFDIASSNNTGVYKNLVYGYATGDRAWPLSVPDRWAASRPRQLGALTLKLLDLSSTNLLDNPQHGFYLVLGRLEKPDPRLPLTGFWEVIPETAYSSLEQVWDCVRERNSADALKYGGPYDYTLCMSGDTVRLNPDFSQQQPAFLLINGSREALRAEHVDLSHQQSLVALPLLEAREVDEQYRFTGTVYAYAAGDGRMVVTNPHLRTRLEIDSSDPESPRRRIITWPKNPEAATVAPGNPN